MNKYSHVSPATLNTAPGATAADDLCDVDVIHPDAVESVRATLCNDEELTLIADTFQILANPTRLQIVRALATRELCVCDLAAVVGASQSSVSHHLRQLRQMRLVRYRRDGRMAFYSLDDEHVARLFDLGLEHVREELR